MLRGLARRRAGIIYPQWPIRTSLQGAALFSPTAWTAADIPRAVMLRISVSVDRSASENLVQRLGSEMPTASSPHDGVKGAIFPEFGARAPCGFQKIDNPTPHGGRYGPT